MRPARHYLHIEAFVLECLDTRSICVSFTPEHQFHLHVTCCLRSNTQINCYLCGTRKTTRYKVQDFQFGLWHGVCPRRSVFQVCVAQWQCIRPQLAPDQGATDHQ